MSEPPKIYVVTKTLPGMDGAWSLVGVFGDPILAEAACIGDGVFNILPVEQNKIYRGREIALSASTVVGVTAAAAKRGIV